MYQIAQTIASLICSCRLSSELVHNIQKQESLHAQQFLTAHYCYNVDTPANICPNLLSILVCIVEIRCIDKRAGISQILLNIPQSCSHLILERSLSSAETKTSQCKIKLATSVPSLVCERDNLSLDVS